MVISVNMTGVSEKGEALQPGYYQAAVSKCEVKTSKAGNQYISWQFNVLEPVGFEGRKAFFNNSLLQNSLWSFKRTLKALGYPEEELEGEVEFDPSDVLGVECTLVVVEDVYNGETTGRVDQVLPAGAAQA